MEKIINGTRYFFFYRSKLSNWNFSKFVVDGITYNCGEQYMMHQKALTFGDLETAKQIMSMVEPSVQKALGRKVTNFNQSVWDNVKYDLIKKGLRERFNQNPHLKELLLKDKGCVFVEASPVDRIWGIGFNESEAEENIDKWGENLLGKILTDLSNE